ncbi:hypothetical protein [Lacihabitans soyangensis]|uniref:Lipocalin-like domain-containing protein n=1 Tax=Lacihabitans soyangensis TaxID=869394 RepID=A0AAE3KTK2_9BACT|nr:hypothetical protein [Lacihabitans soyangensis]MCP9762321.1 hypothetical protein [Lacihabitans soyangensis]
MKYFFGIIALLFTFCACEKQSAPSLEGTWELISATSTEKDSTFSTFNLKVKMIKIINGSHFAFLSHDITGSKDSTRAAYTAGAGTYTLKDSIYTENLEYFIDPQWENHKFEFVVKIQNDTLVQKGVEKLEKLGIDRIIVEKYVRVK